MYGLWGYLLKAKALAPINARRVLEGGWYLINLREKTINYTRMLQKPKWRTQEDSQGRCTVRMFPHVRPTEVWLKCHQLHHLSPHITSVKWKITRKRWRGRGGATVQKGRSIFFLQRFVKSRPITDKRKSAISNCFTQKTQDKQPFWNVEQSTMKINSKNQLTLKILASIQSRGSR